MRLLLFLLLPLISYAQIEVKESDKQIIGEIKQAGVPALSLTKDGDTYSIKFYNNQNRNELSYASFWFKDKDDAVDNLYDVIKTSLQDKKAKEVEIVTDSGTVGLEFIKSFTGTFVRFAKYDENGTSVARSLPMTKRQVNKLFGR